MFQLGVEGGSIFQVRELGERESTPSTGNCTGKDLEAGHEWGRGRKQVRQGRALTVFAPHCDQGTL